MAVPKFDFFLYPFLCQLKEKDVSKKEMMLALAKHFNLSEEDMSLRTGSGRVTQLNDRTGWTFQYLRRAGLVENAKRGIYHITSKGTEYLNSHDNLLIKDLKKYPEFLEFFIGNKDKEEKEEKVKPQDLDLFQDSDEVITPTEQLEKSFAIINEDLADQLLQKIYEKDSYFFEHLVLDLLLKMGYGDPTDKSAKVTSKSHDSGIDGVIPQDKLGLDKIYIQAKQYASNNPIDKPTLQAFSGALDEQNATKGVFITTSYFTKGAVNYAVNKSSRKIVLIDGKQLVSYMIEYNVGVSTKKIYEIKKLDLDYFED